MKKVISFGNSKDNYSSGGRIINRKMKTDEIFEYLDLKGYVDVDIIIEFKKLENKYINKNVDILLTEKLKTDSADNVIERSKIFTVIKNKIF